MKSWPWLLLATLEGRKRCGLGCWISLVPGAEFATTLFPLLLTDCEHSPPPLTFTFSLSLSPSFLSLPTPTPHAIRAALAIRSTSFHTASTGTRLGT